MKIYGWFFISLFLISLAISSDSLANKQASRLEYGDVLVSGNLSLNQVAITFDDGPSDAYTPLFLDVLKKKRIRATFFLVGKNVERFPDIAKRIIVEGHAVGSHSYSHRWDSKDKDGLKEEIKFGQETIRNTLGIKTNLFRPPYGRNSSDFVDIAKEQKLYIIKWSVDSRDWKNPGVDKIIQRIIDNTKGGSIILLHDSYGSSYLMEERKHTLTALPSIIDNLQKKGFKFVTIPEMMASGGWVKEQPSFMLKTISYLEEKMDEIIQWAARQGKKRAQR